MTTPIEPDVLNNLRARANGSTDGAVLVSAHGVIRILDALKEAQERAERAEQDTADAYLGVIKTLEVRVFEARARCDALADALKGAVEKMKRLTTLHISFDGYGMEVPELVFEGAEIATMRGYASHTGLMRAVDDVHAALDKANAAIGEGTGNE